MNKNSYNKIVEQWQEVRDTTKVNKPIVEFAKKLPNHSQVLDIGCGTGKPIAAFLASKKFYVKGIDLPKR
jgi:2-polyprenyl-3-methyl-5-hydroxy-6-metoxy-1,4-benzoquinol methylase